MSTSFDARLPLYLIGIIALGSAIRCAHLFSDHYYVLSPDSYYFHFQARAVADGVPLDAYHTGIVYPVGVLASVTSLFAASVIIPLAISAMITLLVFVFASKYFGVSAGICAALVWNVLPQAYFITAAGYLDRDGFSTLLIGIGAFSFYHFSQLPFRPWRIPVGSILAGSATAGIGELIDYEWSWAGRFLFVAVICGLFAGMFVQRILEVRSVRAVMYEPWVALIISMIGFLLLENDLGGHSGDALSMANKSHWEIPIGETRRLQFWDVILWYHPVLILIGGYGVYLMARRRSSPDLAILAWVLVLFVLAFGAKRCLVPALPALSIIIGIGAAPVLATGWRVFRECFHDWRHIAFVSMVPIALVGGFLWNGYTHGTIDRMTANANVQDAMDYLENETPPGSRVLAFADYGYWILSLADRFAISHGGDPASGLMYTGPALCASCEPELADAMRVAGADYFLVNRADYTTNILDVITHVCNPNEDPETVKEGAYAWKVLENETLPGRYLSVVYQNDDTAILKAEYPGQAAENALGERQRGFPHAIDKTGRYGDHQDDP